MITGDNQLTAAYIGRELNFGPTSNGSLFAYSATNNKINWHDINNTFIMTSTSYEMV
jgi:manganese-transporting P-type ATPase